MKNIKFDYITNTITVTKAFYKAAQNYGTEEQVTMTKLKREFPDMEIAVRSPKAKRNDSKGLTYEYMRKFIRKFDRKNAVVFEDVIIHYEEHNNGAAAYRYVKEWFLENYPEYKEVIIDTAPKKVAA